MLVLCSWVDRRASGTVGTDTVDTDTVSTGNWRRCGPHMRLVMSTCPNDTAVVRSSDLLLLSCESVPATMVLNLVEGGSDGMEETIFTLLAPITGFT